MVILMCIILLNKLRFGQISCSGRSMVRVDNTGRPSGWDRKKVWNPCSNCIKNFSCNVILQIC